MLDETASERGLLLDLGGTDPSIFVVYEISGSLESSSGE